MSLQGWKGTSLTIRQWRLRSISNQNTICGTIFISWFWWGWRTQLSTLDLRATWPRWLRSVNKRLLCFVLFSFCSSMMIFMLLLILKLYSLLDFAQFANCGSEPPQHSRQAIEGWACVWRAVPSITICSPPPLYRRNVPSDIAFTVASWGAGWLYSN